MGFEQYFPELHIMFKYVLAKEKRKTIHFFFLFHEAYSYFFLHFLFFASCLTLSFKRCLAFRTSSSSSFPEMRPSATDLGSLFTLFQRISLFTVLLATMSSDKLRRKRVCSSVNFRQTREDSPELETANDSEGVFTSQLSRNSITFPVLVHCPVGRSMLCMNSSLNRLSLITTAFTVWVVDKFAPFSFFHTAHSSMTPVSSSVLNIFFNSSVSLSLHETGVDTFSFVSVRSCLVFRETRFFTARLPKSVWLTLS